MLANLVLNSALKLCTHQQYSSCFFCLQKILCIHKYISTLVCFLSSACFYFRLQVAIIILFRTSSHLVLTTFAVKVMPNEEPLSTCSPAGTISWGHFVSHWWTSFSAFSRMSMLHHGNVTTHRVPEPLIVSFWCYEKRDIDFLVALIFNFLLFTALNIVLKEAANFTAFCIPGLQLLQLANHVILEFDL